MAVYAPGAEGHVKVASLVEAGPEGGGALSALRVDGKVWTLDGRLGGPEGTVPYLGAPGPDGYEPMSVMRRDVYVCETQDEWNACLSADADAAPLGWTRESFLSGRWQGRDADRYCGGPKASMRAWFDWNHRGNRRPQDLACVQDGAMLDVESWRWPTRTWTSEEDPGDLSGRLLGRPFWFWNPHVSSAVQACASEDAAYWISDADTDEYDVTVQLCSTADADERLAFVAAAFYGEDGVPRTLSFVRTPNCSDPETLTPAYHFYIAGPGLGVDPSSPPEWDGEAVSASFGPLELSSRFFADRDAFQKRFTEVDADGFPEKDGRGFWKYRPDETVRFWLGAALSAERMLAARGLLSCVAEDSSSDDWPVKDVLITEEMLETGLSSPGLWWWRSRAQWDMAKEYSRPYGWRRAGDAAARSAKATRVRVARKGDVISAWATCFSGTPSLPDGLLGPDTSGNWGQSASQTPWPETAREWEDLAAQGKVFKIVVDLSKGGSCNGVDLGQFSTAARPGGCRFGFASKGQPAALWRIVEMKTKKTVVNLETGYVAETDPAGGDPRYLDVLPAEAVGRGRFCVNPATGKTFFAFGDSVLKISG